MLAIKRKVLILHWFFTSKSMF